MVASHTPTLTLQKLADFCSDCLPALAGNIRPSEHAAAEAAAQMHTIYQGLAKAYPEAGAIYWGSRAWKLWLWQPVFIGVWAASCHHVSPRFDDFAHCMNPLFTEAYTLPPQDLAVLRQDEAVAETAAHLKAWAVRELALLQTHYPLPEKLALYYLGDALLNALASAHRFGLIDANETLRLEKMWQAALDIRCCGGLVWQEDAQEFLVEMLSCCQHYRRNGAEHCQGCPKTRKQRGLPPCGRSGEDTVLAPQTLCRNTEWKIFPEGDFLH